MAETAPSLTFAFLSPDETSPHATTPEATTANVHRRRRWLATSAVLLALSSAACGQGAVNPLAAGSPTPTESWGDIPTPPEPSNHKPIPTLPPDPGSPERCGRLPFPGPIIHDYQLHDCWVVRDDGDPIVFYLGGTNRDDRKQGVLFVEGTEVGKSGGMHKAPGRHGDLTITFARKSFVCFKEADGTQGAFDTQAAKFVVATTFEQCG